MAVSVACPECGASVPVSEELLGKKMRCKGCSAVFVASAAKVPAGSVAGSGRPTPINQRAVRPGSSPAKPATNMPLIVGGTVAAAVMLGVTVWALAFRGGDSASGEASKGVVAKVNIVDNKTPAVTPKVEEKSTVESKPAMTTTPTRSGPAWFVDAPKSLPFLISPDTAERVKRSAVWIKVSTPAGGGFGSGWMAEPGIVITNAHVVGMKEPAAPPPTGIKLTIEAGLKNERTFDGQLLGLDRDNDLAVIRMIGENLPAPMPIARSSELAEGQKLYVCGYPLGNQIAKTFDEGRNQIGTTLKLRESTVSGRLPTKHGSIKYVQIEGGADRGNSGGMIVDPSGHVRCILVAGIPGTNLRFSIPSEYAVYLLQGRILKVIPAQPYQVEDKVRMPMTALVADPMKRLKTVSMELWPGEPGKRVRPASAKAPEKQNGDGPVQKITLPYDPNAKVPLGESHLVKGECELPPLDAGQVYWVRPHYVNNDGEERWGEAVALDFTGLPVERKPAMLTVRHQVGIERDVNLVSRFGVGATPEGGELHLQDFGLRLKLAEKINSVTPDGTAKVSIKYKDVGLTDADTEGYIKQNIRGLLDVAKGMVAEMQVTKTGMIKKPEMKMDKVPVPIRGLLGRFNAQTLQSLESLSLGLPDRELQPGDSWTRDANFAVNVGPFTETALFKLTYRYMGTRVRDGREEAVIEYDGNIVRGEGNELALDPEITKGSKDRSKDKGKNSAMVPRNMYGRARGAALVDLSTGTVTLARTHADMEFEVSYVQANLKFGGALRVDIDRSLAAGAARPQAERLLPNQEIVLYPFVGAPDVSLTANP